MSHFSCYVVVDKKNLENIKENDKEQIAFNIAEKMLEPFDEQNEKLFEFQDLTESYQKEYNGEEVESWNGKNIVKVSAIVNKETDEVICYQNSEKAEAILYRENIKEFNNLYKIKEVVPKELFSSLEEYVSTYLGDELNKDGLYGYSINPNAQWDWYRLGGRWSNAFKSKAPNIRETDIIRKGDIDIEQMIKEAKTKSKEEWLKFKSFDIDFDKTISWSEILKKEGFSIEELRKEYRNQPESEKINKFKKLNNFHFSCPIDYFCNGDYDLYQKKSAFNAISSYAILKDGNWFDLDEFERDLEKKMTAWFNLFNSIDDDDWILNIDCHI